MPNNVVAIDVDVRGAQGSNDGGGFTAPGNGGKVTGIVSVNAGDSILVYVGGMGTAPTGGFNGGGDGGTANTGPFGGGGGGASDIRIGTNKLVIAGGGGGCGGYNGVDGGHGGGLVGQNGVDGAGFGGGGGTQSVEGAGGIGGGSSGLAGTSGVLGQGGTGGNTTGGNGFGGAGGGGGGYYGGGGGGAAAILVCCPDWSGGGGGGSSYADAGVTNVVHTQGSQTGNGEVSITAVISTDIIDSQSLQFLVYPNQFTESLNIIEHFSTNNEWTIFNILGEKIMNGTLVKEKTSIDTRTISNGVYFIQFKSENKISTRKVVKK